MSYITGYVGTPTLQGTNYVLYIISVLAHPHFRRKKKAHPHLRKKPYVLYIMGVSAHPHFREEILHAACCGCGVK